MWGSYIRPVTRRYHDITVFACWLLSLHYGQAVCFCCLDRVERKPIFSCRTGWTLRAVKVVLSSLRGNEDFWGKVFLCSDGKPGSLIWSLTNYEHWHFGRVQFYRRALQFSFSVRNIINMSEMIYLFSSFHETAARMEGNVRAGLIRAPWQSYTSGQTSVWKKTSSMDTQEKMCFFIKVGIFVLS